MINLMLQPVIGIVFFILSLFLAFKIVGNIVKTFLIALLLLLSYYLIFGYVPYTDKIDLKSIFSLSIQDVERDVDNNLLISVKNNWFFAAKNITVTVDEKNTIILNNITKINGRDKTILQILWDKDFNYILVKSDIGESKYKK